MQWILIWLVALAIGLAIAYTVIHAAVRAAISDHWKTVRWYEMTGEWAPRVRSWRYGPRELIDGPVEPVKPSKTTLK